MALLWFLAGLLGLLLLVVLALLFLPADFSARLEGAAAPGGGGDPAEEFPTASAAWHVHLRWAWGLVALVMRRTPPGSEMALTIAGFRVPVGRARPSGAGGAEGGEPGAKRRAAAAARRRAARRRRKRRRPTDWHLIWAAVREGARLVGRLWRRRRLRIQGDVTYGFDDPADTGMALAALSVMPLPSDLRLRPAWLEPGLAGWLRMSGRVYLAEAVWAAIKVWWNLPVRRRWWPRFKARWQVARIQTGG